MWVYEFKCTPEEWNEKFVTNTHTEFVGPMIRVYVYHNFNNAVKASIRKRVKHLTKQKLVIPQKREIAINESDLPNKRELHEYLVLGIKPNLNQNLYTRYYMNQVLVYNRYYEPFLYYNWRPGQYERLLQYFPMKNWSDRFITKDTVSLAKLIWETQEWIPQFKDAMMDAGCEEPITVQQRGSWLLDKLRVL